MEHTITWFCSVFCWILLVHVSDEYIHRFLKNNKRKNKCHACIFCGIFRSNFDRTPPWYIGSYSAIIQAAEARKNLNLKMHIRIVLEVFSVGSKNSLEKNRKIFIKLRNVTMKKTLEKKLKNHMEFRLAYNQTKYYHNYHISLLIMNQMEFRLTYNQKENNCSIWKASEIYLSECVWIIKQKNKTFRINNRERQLST